MRVGNPVPCDFGVRCGVGRSGRHLGHQQELSPVMARAEQLPAIHCRLQPLVRTGHVAFVLTVGNVGAWIDGPRQPAAAQDRVNKPVVDSDALGPPGVQVVDQGLPSQMIEDVG